MAALGLPLLLSPVLGGVLLGMVLVGAGTFFAQATATGFVSRAATDRAGASGIYLAAYFSGGLVGSAALGQAFDRFGWPASVAGVALALAVAAILGFNLRTASESRIFEIRYTRGRVSEMPKTFDAIIIGSGQAGPSLAVRLAQAGMKTALIEREHLGGTCVNDGCIPTKTLVASARVAHMARRAADYGVRVGGEVASI